MGLGRPPKVRELLQQLRLRGWIAVRQNGSHQIWQAPNGTRVPVVVNHPNDPVSRTVLKTVYGAMGLAA